MGVCILLVDSKYKLWYHDMLEPYLHYVPVKKDLSDLISQIKWCRNNDKKCQQISINAKKFHDEYLGQNGALDYLQKLLINLKQETGIYLYNSSSPWDKQVQNEEKQLEMEFPNIGKTVKDIHIIPFQPRSYGMLRGLQWILNLINTESDFFKIAHKNKQVFAGKNTKCDEYTVAGFDVCVKNNDNNKKNIHETFVGTKCINSLSKYCPNFTYYFGILGDQKNIIMENVTGETLQDYIHGPRFNMKEFLFIILQLSLALHVGQKQCALVHNDLTPWNIIIQRHPKPITFDYLINYNTVYRVTTQIIPIIIDFGSAHVVHQDIHYGAVNMYKSSTIQDIIILLITSIDQITKKRLPKNDINRLLTLANFITGTNYRKKPFFFTGNTGLGELRYFLAEHKDYSCLISDPKYELEQKTPLDLIHYIQTKFNTNFPVQKVDSLYYSLDIGNSRQVYEYTLSESVEDKITSFTNVFKSVKKCKLPETDNILFVYYVLQTITTNLHSVYDNMLVFLQTKGIDPSIYIKIYENVIKHVTDIYKIINTNQTKHIIYKANDYKNLIRAPYTPYLFTQPKKILQLYHKNNETNLSIYQDIIELTLLHSGKFQLPESIKKYYITNCHELLSINSLYMINNIANTVTLYLTAKSLYLDDYNMLRSKLETKKGDCSVANEYIGLYEKFFN
jgi:hypothetical protein